MDRAEPWFRRFSFRRIDPGRTLVRQVQSSEKYQCLSPNSELLHVLAVWRKNWTKPWFGRFGVQRKASSMAGSELGERTVPNQGSTYSFLQTLNLPNQGSACSFLQTQTLATFFLQTPNLPNSEPKLQIRVWADSFSFLKKRKIRKKVLSPNSEHAEPRLGLFLSPNFEPKLRIRVLSPISELNEPGFSPCLSLNSKPKLQTRPCLFSELGTCLTRVQPVFTPNLPNQGSAHCFL